MVLGKFEWQTGFGAFSLGQSQIGKIVQYIEKQEEHHQKKSFRQEYTEFLMAYQVDFKPEYIFEDFGVAPTELEDVGEE